MDELVSAAGAECAAVLGCDVSERVSAFAAMQVRAIAARLGLGEPFGAEAGALVALAAGRRAAASLCAVDAAAVRSVKVGDLVIEGGSATEAAAALEQSAAALLRGVGGRKTRVVGA